MRNMHEAQRTIAAFRMCTKIAKRVTTIILLYYVHGTLSIIRADSGGETIRTAEGQYTRIPVFVTVQQQYDVYIYYTYCVYVGRIIMRARILHISYPSSMGFTVFARVG